MERFQREVLYLLFFFFPSNAVYNNTGAIFGCAFSFPLFLSPLSPSLLSSLLGPHILRMEEMRGIKKGKVGHITPLKAVYFALSFSLHPFFPRFLCLSIFLCLPSFFPRSFPYFSLLFHISTLLNLARLRTSYISGCLPSALVPMWL